MAEIDTCPECGTPMFISSQHVWLENGIIRPRRDERQRLVFFECGNIDPLFEGIEDIIGIPIGHLVIDASRRYSREYMKYVVPEDLRAMIRNREIDLTLVFDSTFLIWKAMGYGKLTLEEVKYEGTKDDYITVLAERPYSVPLAVGNFAGAIEAIVGREPGISYEETSPGVYRITIYESENPRELKSRLLWKALDRECKEGHCRLEKCPRCEAPLALQEFKWDLANGSIRSALTRRRMVMTGPALIDPIFDELEEELGEMIPQVVVEAQRRFVKSGFFAVEEVTTEEGMREKLAVRGLGLLEYLRMGRKGVQLKIANVALPLLGIGLAQGLFEKAFNIESRVEWEFTPDGDLLIEVAPVTP